MIAERIEENELCDGIDIIMLLNRKKDPSFEDSQEELLGVATAPPTIETSGATLAVPSSQGSEEGRQNGGRLFQRLHTFISHGSFPSLQISFQVLFGETKYFVAGEFPLVGRLPRQKTLSC